VYKNYKKLQKYMKNKGSVFLSYLFLSIFFSFAFSSCEWKNEETEFGIVVCDTSQVTLSGTVKPILQGNCYSCHSSSTAGTAGAGINLENYTSLKSSANNASFLGSIKHSSAYSSMPKGAAKLSSCDIRLIEMWVKNGANND